MGCFLRCSSSVCAVWLVVGAATSLSSNARADDVPAPIHLELNRLEAQGDACRAYLLADNARGEAWRSLKLDLFVLDPGGVAQKRLALEAGPIAAHKTVIKVFDLAGLACGAVGRVLLNDVLACETAAGPRTDCLDRVETSSKVPSVAFDK